MRNFYKQYRSIIGVFIFTLALSATLTVVVSQRIGNQSQAVEHQDYTNVSIDDKTISPSTVTLKVGEKLRITNQDSVERELSLGSGSAHEEHNKHDDGHNDSHEKTEVHEHKAGFSTGLIGTDEAWEGSFSETGTYFLHDHDNPEINLLIVVYSEE